MAPFASHSAPVVFAELGNQSGHRAAVPREAGERGPSSSSSDGAASPVGSGGGGREVLLAHPSHGILQPLPVLKELGFQPAYVHASAYVQGDTSGR